MTSDPFLNSMDPGMGSHWYPNPMEAVIDSGGRILVPKQLRDALGLTPGSTVDISAYGPGLQIVPGGRSARLVRNKDGRLVANADTVVTDEMMFALIDSGRR
ncbi:type II toxin-antitoxin system antitoxin VapB27 [Mycolicibacterium llatzerense]